MYFKKLCLVGAMCSLVVGLTHYLLVASYAQMFYIEALGNVLVGSLFLLTFLGMLVEWMQEAEMFPEHVGWFGVAIGCGVLGLLLSMELNRRSDVPINFDDRVAQIADVALAVVFALQLIAAAIMRRSQRYAHG